MRQSVCICYYRLFNDSCGVATPSLAPSVASPFPSLTIRSTLFRITYHTAQMYSNSLTLHSNTPLFPSLNLSDHKSPKAAFQAASVSALTSGLSLLLFSPLHSPPVARTLKSAALRLLSKTLSLWEHLRLQTQPDLAPYTTPGPHQHSANLTYRSAKRRHIHVVKKEVWRNRLRL